MAATVGITLRVPLTRSGLMRALSYLVRANMAYLRRHPSTPPLYRSGVRYRREPRGREDWKTIPEILADGFADCEDLAAWLVSERKMKGQVATPYLKRSGRLWHVQVKTSSGIEDPSARLGM